MKSPEQKAIEKQLKEQKRIANEEARRYRASQIIENTSRTIGDFRLLDPDAENVLQVILDLNPNENMELDLDSNSIPSKYNFSIGLELEKLLQYGMISNYVLYMGGAFVTISSQGLNYFSNKSKAEKVGTISTSLTKERQLENGHTLDEMDYELDSLLSRAKSIELLPLNQKKKDAINEWLDGVHIFNERYLQTHVLHDRLKSLLFHRTKTVFNDVLSLLKAIKRDSNKKPGVRPDINSLIGGYDEVNKEYDVFISHASKDKIDYVDSLVAAVKKLGIRVFYDSDEISWGDNFKQVILNGTANSEFAIIVISDNFFDREWTEKELNEFLNRQNSQSQKIVLPLLLGITLEDLNLHYPKLGEIQCLNAKDKTYEEIVILLAKELIKRYKQL